MPICMNLRLSILSMKSQHPDLRRECLIAQAPTRVLRQTQTQIVQVTRRIRCPDVSSAQFVGGGESQVQHQMSAKLLPRLRSVQNGLTVPSAQPTADPFPASLRLGPSFFCPQQALSRWRKRLSTRSLERIESTARNIRRSIADKERHLLPRARRERISSASYLLQTPRLLATMESLAASTLPKL